MWHLCMQCKQFLLTIVTRSNRQTTSSNTYTLKLPQSEQLSVCASRILASCALSTVKVYIIAVLAELVVGLDLAALVLVLDNFDMATVATVCFLLAPSKFNQKVTETWK